MYVDEIRVQLAENRPQKQVQERLREYISTDWRDTHVLWQRSRTQKTSYYVSFRWADDFETKYVPKIFETICKQYLIRRNRKGLMEEPFEKIGKYYYDDSVEKKNGKFDIVTQDDRGYIFYEAKFRKDPVTESMVQNEIRQVTQTGLNCYKYGFFSRSGFLCDQEENQILIELKELYT